MFLGLEPQMWLGLTVVGAVVSTGGALAGIFLKEFFFARSFERWKQECALEKVYERYRDPLFLSARELASRVAEILKYYPTVYLTEDVRKSCPSKQLRNDIDDPYFRRYKLISTVYRFSAFFAWLELYRQEITLLRSGNNTHTRALESAVDEIRSDLADGQLNKARDWGSWRDVLVFREELRAIGEALIETRGDTRTVMGYGRFCEEIESSAPNAVQRWFPVVLNFLLDLETHGKDFRQTRLKRMLVHLVALLELLKDAPIETYLKDAPRDLAPEVIACNDSE